MENKPLAFAMAPRSARGALLRKQREQLRRAADAIEAELTPKFRAQLKRVAKRLERGEKVDLDRDFPMRGLEFALDVLRWYADHMPDEPRKRKGRQAQKVDRAGLSLHYAMLRRRMNDTQAVAKLASMADVTIEAIKKALKKTK